MIIIFIISRKKGSISKMSKLNETQLIERTMTKKIRTLKAANNNNRKKNVNKNKETEIEYDYRFMFIIAWHAIDFSTRAHNIHVS